MNASLERIDGDRIEARNTRSHCERRNHLAGVSRQAPAARNRRAHSPGQYLVTDFPVLSAGRTAHIPLKQWDFTIEGEVRVQQRWDWEQFRALPSETITRDIHCVARWSTLDTVWQAVSLDTSLSEVATEADYLMAFCDGGYTTNLAVEDVTGGKAWIAYGFDGRPLEPEHGGPARLLVPHLYFWKSAKWVRGLRLMRKDDAGFWEKLGYHMHGDPWKEQRYWGDRPGA